MIPSTSLRPFAVSLLILAGCVGVRVAPQRHPPYLHALSDLRAARAHLERPANVSMSTAWDEGAALREIDGAIHDVREAAREDGKRADDRVPVDAGLDWAGRLHRTLDLLRSARRDCDREEDNGYANQPRMHALARIDNAIHLIEDGIRANQGPPPQAYAPPPQNYPPPQQNYPPPPAQNYPPPAQNYPPPPQNYPPPQQQAYGGHPAYLHALEDLRHARAHLERPAAVNMRTSWDENVAIREIDAAMHELREAAIDDGKPLTQHPPIDGHLDWGGRLHRTLELLRKARRDCEQEEDNAFARGLRGRALQHIDAAAAFVERGIRDNHY